MNADQGVVLNADQGVAKNAEGGSLSMPVYTGWSDRVPVALDRLSPDGVFADEKLTTALLDRLGHHAHIITTKGASYRTAARRRGAGGDSPRLTP